MSKSVSNIAAAAVAAAASHPASQDDALRTIRRLFMLMHGMYGNLFLTKFATGDLDDQGKDKGVKSAQMVWAGELSKFDGETIRAAADRCKSDHQQFPPSLPQFYAMCAAMSPRKAFVAADNGVKQIGISAEAQSAHSKRVREAALARLSKVEDARSGAVTAPVGVSGLCQLIARAVACAGGDEVAALRKVEAKIFKPMLEAA